MPNIKKIYSDNHTEDRCVVGQGGPAKEHGKDSSRLLRMLRCILPKAQNSSKVRTEDSRACIEF